MERSTWWGEEVEGSAAGVKNWKRLLRMRDWEGAMEGEKDKEKCLMA